MVIKRLKVVVLVLTVFVVASGCLTFTLPEATAPAPTQAPSGTFCQGTRSSVRVAFQASTCSPSESASTPSRSNTTPSYSLSTALTLTANGAAGSTRANMLDTLGLKGVPVAKVNASNTSLLEWLNASRDGATLTTANSLWADDEVKLKPSYVRTGRDTFSAEVRNLDLQSATAPNIVNKWVSDRTQGMIPKLVDSFDPAERLSIINGAIILLHMFCWRSWREKLVEGRAVTKQERIITGSTTLFAKHPAPPVVGAPVAMAGRAIAEEGL